MILLILIVLIVISIFITFCFYVAYRLVTPKRLVKSWTPRDLGYDYEDFSVKTDDDVELNGWFIPRGNECVILLHGYSRSRWDEVYMRRLMENLPGMGYSVIAFDFRGHGKSGGKHTTIGYLELLDLKAVYTWARQRCKKIYLIGYSMGGYVALRGSVSMGDKVIADSPFVELKNSAKRALKYFANLPSILTPFILLAAKLIVRVDVEDVNLMPYAEKIKVPALIIVGSKDEIVDVEELKGICNLMRRNNPTVEMWITQGKHVRSIISDEEKYFKKINDFLAK